MTVYEPDFPGAFYFYRNETLQDRWERDLSIDCFTAGDLVLTSGKIVAYDGLIPSLEPFVETVPPGAYPVVLCLTQVGTVWPRVACAMLRFQEIIPSYWKPATCAGLEQEEARLRNVYGVDCGVGCFADVDVMQELASNEATYMLLQKEVHQSRADWVNFCVDQTTYANIIVFSSGLGDGFYPSYFGYDADGNVLCLATDFGIISPLAERQIEKPNKDQLKLDLQREI